MDMRDLAIVMDGSNLSSISARMYCLQLIIAASCALQDAVVDSSR